MHLHRLPPILWWSWPLNWAEKRQVEVSNPSVTNYLRGFIQSNFKGNFIPKLLSEHYVTTESWKKRTFSFLSFTPFWGRKISTIEPDYHWLHMIWLLWEPKKVVFISINDFGCSTILPTNKMVVIMHSVWNWPRMSHSTLRAKRATFTFWVDKSYLKMPKMVHLGEFLKNYCLRFNSVTRQASFNRTIIGGKCQKWDILSNIQTMCDIVFCPLLRLFLWQTFFSIQFVVSQEK